MNFEGLVISRRASEREGGRKRERGAMEGERE